MLKSALRRTASRPLGPASGPPGLAPARAYRKVMGFYKQAEYPPLSLTIDVEDERWLALREKSKRVLAPHPMGLSTQKFLEKLRMDFGIGLQTGLAEDTKLVRALSRKMPDIAYVPHLGKDPRKMTVKLVYPAYYGNLKRGPRTAADYDESTPVGAAAFRQLKGVVTYLLDVHPKGLIRDTFCNLLQNEYSHRLYDVRTESYAFAESMIKRMPDIAVWKVSDEYREYDAIRRAAPVPPPPRPSSIRSRKKLWVDGNMDRFLQWYDDPPSERRVIRRAAKAVKAEARKEASKAGLLAAAAAAGGEEASPA